jgi:hypothetical protein
VRVVERGAVAVMLPAMLLGLAGCGVLARDHACWPYLARQFRGGVPSEVVRELAFQRSRKRVGNNTAAMGYYWRKARKPTDEERADGATVRAYQGWEIVPCPIGRTEQLRRLHEAGGLPSADAPRAPGRGALPSSRRSRTVTE